MLIEYSRHRVTCNRNGDIPSIGHKRMFSLKVLISVLLLEVLICSSWFSSLLKKNDQHSGVGGGGGGGGGDLGLL